MGNYNHLFTILASIMMSSSELSMFKCFKNIYNAHVQMLNCEKGAQESAEE